MTAIGSHTSKAGYDMKKKILSNCIYHHAEQLSYHDNYHFINQVLVPKKGLSRQITEQRQNYEYK